MDLDARPYRAFIAVAETVSFNRAAERLHISQPALSAQVRELERRLGFSLFTRTSRRVALTPEGRHFLDHARRLVLETDWINQTAREIRSNQLRIGAAHYTAAIPERNALIDNFIRAEPDVPVRVLRRSPLQLREDLARGEIDVAILLDIEPSREDAGATDAADTQRWIVGRRPVRLAVPRDHRFASLASLRMEDIKGCEIGMIDRSHGIPLVETVGRALADAGAIPLTLAEGDAQAVLRQCANLQKCAIDLGWFGFEGSGLVSRHVAEWKMTTALVVQAGGTNRREGAVRFLASLGAPREQEARAP